MTRLPRYVTVTPLDGAVITVALPWDQVDAAVRAAGYKIVPRLPEPVQISRLTALRSVLRGIAGDPSVDTIHVARNVALRALSQDEDEVGMTDDSAECECERFGPATPPSKKVGP